MLVAVLIVAAHDAPCVGLLHCSLEWRQVYLVESTVRDSDIYMSAELLLVVENIMLYAACHAVFLQVLYIWHHQSGREEWIFSHVLEVASAERRAIDINARSQQYVLLTIASLLAHRLAIERSKLWVPCGSKRRKRWEGVVVPVSPSPIVPVYLYPDAVRAVGHPQFWYSQTWAAWRTELTLCV